LLDRKTRALWVDLDLVASFGCWPIFWKVIIVVFVPGVDGKV